MKHMDPKEVQQIGEAMATLPTVSSDQFGAVADEFTTDVNEIDPKGIGAQDFTRRVMVEALGENRAETVLSKVIQKPTPKGVEALRWMDARSVAAIIKNEHPQIQAIVLSNLDADHAAKVLMKLPEEGRYEIVARVAQLEALDAVAIEELDAILEKQLGNHQTPPPASINGVSIAASLLNSLDNEVEKGILDSITELDGDLANKIGDLMFIFEDLLALDDRGMQRLMREVSTDLLSKALKGSNEKMMSKFLDNMSSRAAEMLKDDIDAMGPIKLTEVEEAQKEILTAAAKLSEDGEIQLGSSGGDDFV
ncbi:UNVERIFIED_CONTAM: hypothetical protein GTU68_065239 [Idotea baltica]|nr:hypothetical protein [Idotea baltica]